MINFAQNPYRVLGVFANDQLRIRTANIARIRAFRKVGKDCHFDSDFVDIFGSIDRSEPEIEKAISLLSSETDSEYYSYFWIHRNARLNPDSTASIDIVHSGLSGEDKASCVNVIVGAYVAENYDLVAQYFLRLFEVDKLTDDMKKRLLITLVNDDTDDEEETTNTWWKRFKGLCTGTLFHTGSLNFIMQVYNEAAINYLDNYVRDKRMERSEIDWKAILSMQKKAQPYFKTIIETSENENGLPNPEGQLALSEYSKMMLVKVKQYYNNTRFWDAKPVENIVSLLREIYKISYSSKVKDDCTEFGKKLKQEIAYLAPEEVKSQSLSIRKEIEDFCRKPDEARWSLQLLKNCVPHLIQIKAALGNNNPYYIRISTQIADNALYACQNDLESAKRKYENPRNDVSVAKLNFANKLRLASQLCVNLEQLNLETRFVDDKLKRFNENIKEYLSENDDIEIEIPMASISLVTEDDVYAECNDYASLLDYTRNYPNGSHFGEAMQRLWEIEDDAFPKIGTSFSEYRKALLSYKRKFPNSHNEDKVLDTLNRMLLGTTIGTVYEYRSMLQLWPDHPSAALIKERIDDASFKQSNSIPAWEDYLKEFPKGLHRLEATKKIADAKQMAIKNDFDGCQTIADYNRFILHNPSHQLSLIAQLKIEDIVYQAALKTGQYGTYYSKYPNGRYVEQLREAEEERQYKLCKTLVDLRNYVQKYPNGKYGILANDIIGRKRRKKNSLWIIAILATAIAIITVLLISTTPNQVSNSATPSAVKETSSVDDSPTKETLSEQNSESGKNIVTEPTYDPDEEYRDNSLRTGSKPYASSFGRAQTGENYFDFKTSGNSDYVVIVKRSRDNRYVNHIYIKGGETARMYVPDGNYLVYFYSGKGWNPNKIVGGRTGGFVYGGVVQKDGPVKLFSAYMEYTLYPVVNGNLRLETANEDEAFN